MIAKAKRSSCFLLVAAVVLATGAANAQTPAPAPAQPTSQVKCLPTKQALPKIPELVSSGGRLRGTIMLVSEKNLIAERNPLKNPDGSSVQSGAPNAFSACFPQWVRAFRSPEADPPYAVIPEGGTGNPMPGPTLRARVGDTIQLTFLNNVNPAVFNNSVDGGAGIDRGDQKQCDDTSAGYPGRDTYPNCFHGSTTANIHFHGTHTNPNTTGDNVFLEVLSSQRLSGNPPVKPGDVKPLFDEFFDRCEAELKQIQHREWPRKWTDLPADWTKDQKAKLLRFDAQAGTKYPVWPVNEQELANGAWPQYYIGSYPYCFRLPEYGVKPAATTTAHAEHTGGAGMAEREGGSWSPLLTEDPPRLPLQMGQAPGTHWYHAHKHGSTTINVSNGMVGTFIIEGKYDDELNEAYKAYAKDGKPWTRTQPLLVINQIGTSPNLMKGAGQDRGPDFSINGRMNPVITMAPGEVQLWRIVNTSSRAGVLFQAPPAGFHWRQLAQDGVQFNDANYQNSLDKAILLASGNRADLLVKAPASCASDAACSFQVRNTVDPGNLSPFPINLLTVRISGTKPSPAMDFLKTAPSFPEFLADIPASAVKATKIIDFSTVPQQFNGGQGPPKQPAAVHKIDGKQFDGDVGALVRLNTIEEWTVRNFTPNIAHPFHIHINPFQVVEMFEPNATLQDGTTPRYITDPNARTSADQCLLNPNDESTWKPCDRVPSSRNAIWWDVMPIPTALEATYAKGTPINDAAGNQVVIPGYFKMRSRFVDFAGFYVIHCHILAHEDRGMMTVVEVAPSQSPYSHH
jgi:FtsP/CotA-like multicopper oxidase with cupredoxin domain